MALYWLSPGTTLHFTFKGKEETEKIMLLYVNLSSFVIKQIYLRFIFSLFQSSFLSNPIHILISGKCVCIATVKRGSLQITQLCSFAVL
jgi:hypothetical protein